MKENGSALSITCRRQITDQTACHECPEHSYGAGVVCAGLPQAESGCETACATMKRLYQSVQNVTVFEGTLDRNKDDRKNRAKRLSEMLKRYEDLLDLKERRETIDRVLEFEKKKGISFQMMSFEEDLRIRQREQINRKIEAVGDVSEEAAISLLDKNIEELKGYLYYTSAGYIKKIGAPRNAELKESHFCTSSGGA